MENEEKYDKNKINSLFIDIEKQYRKINNKDDNIFDNLTYSEIFIKIIDILEESVKENNGFFSDYLLKYSNINESFKTSDFKYIIMANSEINIIYKTCLFNVYRSSLYNTVINRMNDATDINDQYKCIIDLTETVENYISNIRDIMVGVLVDYKMFQNVMNIIDGRYESDYDKNEPIFKIYRFIEYLIRNDTKILKLIMPSVNKNIKKFNKIKHLSLFDRYLHTACALKTKLSLIPNEIMYNKYYNYKQIKRDQIITYIKMIENEIKDTYIENLIRMEDIDIKKLIFNIYTEKDKQGLKEYIENKCMIFINNCISFSSFIYCKNAYIIDTIRFYSKKKLIN